MYHKQPNTIKSFELRITHCKCLYKSNPKPTFNLELRMVIRWLQQLFLLMGLRMIILLQLQLFYNDCSWDGDREA
jgi:hypothetical protein